MSKVTSYPMGRLGNCLFSYAAGIAYARRTGREWVWPRHSKPEWDPSLSVGFGVEWGDQSGEWRTWKEPAYGWHGEVPDFPGENVRLHGYLHSYRYFWDHIAEIREIFPKPILQPGKIAVHVRGGDYVGNSHFARMEPLEMFAEWFSYHDASDILVFTDDSSVLPYELIEYECKEKDPVTAMRMMAGCDGIIGANSTFSLWAAFLSGHDNVIFPKAWYAGPSKHLDTTHLMPEHWRRI